MRSDIENREQTGKSIVIIGIIKMSETQISGEVF